MEELRARPRVVGTGSRKPEEEEEGKDMDTDTLKAMRHSLGVQQEDILEEVQCRRVAEQRRKAQVQVQMEEVQMQVELEERLKEAEALRMAEEVPMKEAELQRVVVVVLLMLQEEERSLEPMALQATHLHWERSSQEPA